VHSELQFVLLFSVATAVAIGTRWLRVPYTVALVVVGLALGALPLGPRPELTHDLLFAVALPGLLYEAAFHLPERWLKEMRITIAALAVPGVVAVLALTTVLLLPAVRELTLLGALAFSAATVATDPNAVVAVFRDLRAPSRLAALVEGESLFNDGTGVVVFNLVLAAASGAVLSIPAAAGKFALVSLGGALVGALLALLVVQVYRRIDDPMIEVTLSVIAAYGSFALAERFGVSGVIGTVVAGLLCGRAARRGSHSEASTAALRTFWEYVAFALNSIVFLLIGLQVRLPALLLHWKPILLGYAVVVAVRFVVVAATAAVLSPTRERLPWRWTMVVAWSGLRGALAMVLALRLPDSFPSRELVVLMTFGVVLLSIVLQGLTVGPLLRRFGIQAER
jgi:CPA1 family monovalent cation:H+ antiporter